MIKRLSHVSLGVCDIERTVRFYADVLGLAVVHEFRSIEGELYGVFMSAGNGTFLEFFRDCEDLREGGRFRHFCFEVDDLKAWDTRLRGHGFAPELRRGRSDRVLQFFIHDPDGTMIEFQQHDRESKLYPFLPEDTNTPVA